MQIAIAANRAAYEADQLTPGPLHFEGYIIKESKSGSDRGIHLMALGEHYVLNWDNVFCLATKMDDGRTWYSYGGKLNDALTYSGQHQLAAQIRAILPVHLELIAA